MKRLLLVCALIILASTPSHGAAPPTTGPITKALCSSITNPVANKTWCFQQSDGGLYVYQATGWTPIATGSIFDMSHCPGVDVTGAVSSTAALQTCITAATAANKKIFLGNATYLLTGGLSFTDGITFQGAGMGNTKLKVAASVASSVDIFHVQATTHGGYVFSDFQVVPVDSTVRPWVAPARHLFNLDSDTPGTSTTTGTLQIVEIARISQTTDLGGYSVKTSATTPASAYLTGLNIHDCFFGSGLDFSVATLTDKPVIRDNSFLGGNT